jgi:carbon-monoxide dehydrogenase small subunit
VSHVHPLAVLVNGVRWEGGVEARQSLADFLRERLELTGTHLACEHGVCGACSVLVDGAPVRSCLLLAAQADGHEVETVESFTRNGRLGTVEAAFRDALSFQCAFCSPGFIVTTHALLAENPAPTDREIRIALAGNLCRCTGYESIVAGVRLAAERLAAERVA